LPLHILDVYESEKRFVDQRGCLKAVVRALLAEVASRLPAQFLVNKRCKLVERLLIAVTPLL
jgi:hypothetical protein